MPGIKGVFTRNGAFVTLADLSGSSEWGGGRLVYNANHRTLFVQPPGARALSLRSAILRGVPADCDGISVEQAHRLEELGMLYWRNRWSKRWLRRAERDAVPSQRG